MKDLAPNIIHRTKREYLRELVAEKNRWNRPLTRGEKTLGFLGWHERGFLPHCDYPGMTQFVTFRLADSMPASRLHEWKHLMELEDNREKRKKLEGYLDQGHGECLLRDKSIAGRVEHALLHFNRKRYELLAWCVMLNHVHVLVEVWQMPLWKMVKSWKQYTVSQSRAFLLDRRPPARHSQTTVEPEGSQHLRWQREYWDTYARDETQEKAFIKYTENNPIKARLCRLPEGWHCSSARFRDNYRRLVLPEDSGGGDSSSQEVDRSVPGRRPALQYEAVEGDGSS